uniref:Uncharacterized protein n=1 Tax=Erpetoichthys calabaricus TaxID=27687 RepID=A0A8C4RW36_ERPCA
RALQISILLRISLKGNSRIMAEFFFSGINSILNQRGKQKTMPCEINASMTFLPIYMTHWFTQIKDLYVQEKWEEPGHQRVIISEDVHLIIATVTQVQSTALVESHIQWKRC